MEGKCFTRKRGPIGLIDTWRSSTIVGQIRKIILSGIKGYTNKKKRCEKSKENSTREPGS